MYAIHQIRSRCEKPAALSTAILDAIYRKEPFSLVRCGDGEGHILDLLTDPNIDTTAWRLKFFFGHSNYQLSEVQRFARTMRDALANADCLGINFNYEVDKVEELASKMAGKSNGYSGLLSLYRHFDHMDLKKGQRIFSGRVHEDLVRSGYIYDALDAVEAVTIITSRPVGNRLKLLFDVEVEELLIPEEQNFVLEPTTAGDACHFPRIYTSIINRIRPPAPGHLYLIGGGPCGKVYCDVARQRGGIAIDMGAIFDSWAGIVTRTYFGTSGNLFKPDMDKGLLLTPEAIHAATNGRIDRRDRALPTIEVENRFNFTLRRFERTRTHRDLAKQVESLRTEKDGLQVQLQKAADAAEAAGKETAQVVDALRTENQALWERVYRAESGVDIPPPRRPIREAWRRLRSVPFIVVEKVVLSQKLLASQKKIADAEHALKLLRADNAALKRRLDELEAAIARPGRHAPGDEG
ncbi:hypothetical protein ACM64Y_06470 [Novispirillum sp. DQ9]|uniref:hypothetical protein n=1 Tax=Novispirillum sp. DQ9 TaxID=3398612 RepID=UPI003C7BA930